METPITQGNKGDKEVDTPGSTHASPVRQVKPVAPVQQVAISQQQVHSAGNLPVAQQQVAQAGTRLLTSPPDESSVGPSLQSSVVTAHLGSASSTALPVHVSQPKVPLPNASAPIPVSSQSANQIVSGVATVPPSTFVQTTVSTHSQQQVVSQGAAQVVQHQQPPSSVSGMKQPTPAVAASATVQPASTVPPVMQQPLAAPIQTVLQQPISTSTIQQVVTVPSASSVTLSHPSTAMPLQQAPPAQVVTPQPILPIIPPQLSTSSSCTVIQSQQAASTSVAAVPSGVYSQTLGSQRILAAAAPCASSIAAGPGIASQIVLEPLTSHPIAQIPVGKAAVLETPPVGTVPFSIPANVEYNNVATQEVSSPTILTSGLQSPSCPGAPSIFSLSDDKPVTNLPPTFPVPMVIPINVAGLQGTGTVLPPGSASQTFAAADALKQLAMQEGVYISQSTTPPINTTPHVLSSEGSFSDTDPSYPQQYCTVVTDLGSLHVKLQGLTSTEAVPAGSETLGSVSSSSSQAVTSSTSQTIPSVPSSQVISVQPSVSQETVSQVTALTPPIIPAESMFPAGQVIAPVSTVTAPPQVPSSVSSAVSGSAPGTTVASRPVSVSSEPRKPAVATNLEDLKLELQKLHSNPGSMKSNIEQGLQAIFSQNTSAPTILTPAHSQPQILSHVTTTVSSSQTPPVGGAPFGFPVSQGSGTVSTVVSESLPSGQVPVVSQQTVPINVPIPVNQVPHSVASQSVTCSTPSVISSQVAPFTPVSLNQPVSIPVAPGPTQPAKSVPVAVISVPLPCAPSSATVMSVPSSIVGGIPVTANKPQQIGQPVPTTVSLPPTAGLPHPTPQPAITIPSNVQAPLPVSGNLQQSIYVAASVPQSVALPCTVPLSIAQPVPPTMPVSVTTSIPQSVPLSASISQPVSLAPSLVQSIPQLPNVLPQASLPVSVPICTPQHFPSVVSSIVSGFSAPPAVLSQAHSLGVLPSGSSTILGSSSGVFTPAVQSESNIAQVSPAVAIPSVPSSFQGVPVVAGVPVIPRSSATLLNQTLNAGILPGPVAISSAETLSNIPLPAAVSKSVAHSVSGIVPLPVNSLPVASVIPVIQPNIVSSAPLQTLITSTTTVNTGSIPSVSSAVSSFPPLTQPSVALPRVASDVGVVPSSVPLTAVAASLVRTGSITGEASSTVAKSLPASAVSSEPGKLNASISTSAGTTTASKSRLSRFKVTPVADDPLLAKDSKITISVTSGTWITEKERIAPLAVSGTAPVVAETKAGATKPISIATQTSYSELEPADKKAIVAPPVNKGRFQVTTIVDNIASKETCDVETATSVSALAAEENRSSDSEDPDATDDFIKQVLARQQKEKDELENRHKQELEAIISKRIRSATFSHILPSDGHTTSTTTGLPVNGVSTGVDTQHYRPITHSQSTPQFNSCSSLSPEIHRTHLSHHLHTQSATAFTPYQNSKMAATLGGLPPSQPLPVEWPSEGSRTLYRSNSEGVPYQLQPDSSNPRGKGRTLTEDLLRLVQINGARGYGQSSGIPSPTSSSPESKMTLNQMKQKQIQGMLNEQPSGAGILGAPAINPSPPCSPVPSPQTVRRELNPSERCVHPPTCLGPFTPQYYDGSARTRQPLLGSGWAGSPTAPVQLSPGLIPTTSPFAPPSPTQPVKTSASVASFPSCGLNNSEGK